MGHKWKCVGKVITHIPGTICDIPLVVLNLPNELTSQTLDSYSKWVYSVYPNQTNVLCETGLAPHIYPQLGTYEHIRTWKVDCDMDNDLDKNKNKNENFFFNISYSRKFSKYIHRVIDRLKKSFNLSCLRVRISFRIFNNLSELINGYITVKIGRGIHFHELMDRACNFSGSAKLTASVSLQVNPETLFNLRGKFYIMWYYLYTIWMEILAMFSGDLHLLHHYKINIAHFLAF